MPEGQQLRYVGLAASFDDVIVTGNPAEMKARRSPRPRLRPLTRAAPQFVGYYVKDGKVIAVSSMQNDPVASKASELFRLGRFPSPDEIRAGKNILEIDIASAAAGKTA
jgi:hypothetical protein